MWPNMHTYIYTYVHTHTHRQAYTQCLKDESGPICPARQTVLFASIQQWALLDKIQAFFSLRTLKGQCTWSSFVLEKLGS